MHISSPTEHRIATQSLFFASRGFFQFVANIQHCEVGDDNFRNFLL